MVFLSSRRAFLHTAMNAGISASLLKKEPHRMHTSDLRVFVGTYTVDTDSKGIYAFDLNVTGQNAGKAKCLVRQKNPSYLSINAARNTLYAVEESFGTTGEEGGLWAYRIHHHGEALEALGRIGSLGVGPCFLSLDRRNKTLFTANYHSGSILSVRLRDDGSLGQIASHVQLTGSSVHPQRQRSSHPHAIVVTPDNQHVLVADLGADQLKVFRLDAESGMLSAMPVMTISFPGGFGPRHLVLNPRRPFLYVIHEIASVVTTHKLLDRDIVSPAIQTLPVQPSDFTGIADAADIVLDDIHNVLYTSTRQTSSLRRFSVHSLTGLLTVLDDFPSEGRSPHALGLETSGTLLLAANLQTNNVAVFRRKSRGAPAFLESVEIPSPSSIAFF
ncbi:MAG: lactonase family protein [Acidobacteria bacterium]|nr:lactonase family protein [Acidobacteriota bacterium]